MKGTSGAVLAAVGLVAGLVPAVSASELAASGGIVYATSVDGLALGTTAPFPGAAGQDGWFAESAIAPGRGEVQGAVAVAGRALHQLVRIENLDGEQTIDGRFLTPPDLDIDPYIVLRASFRAHTGDLAARNSYRAALLGRDTTHPGFEMLGFGLEGGNGAPKSATGVSVTLSRFDGVGNNAPVTLSVGQGLAWDAWHEITLVAHEASGRYVYVEVDGEIESLSGNLLPRSQVGGGDWQRGELVEELLAVLVTRENFDDECDDDVYWDDLEVAVWSALDLPFLDGFESGGLSFWSSAMP